MAGRWSRAGTGRALWLVAPLVLAACYTMQPVITPRPNPASRVAFEVNDAGRTALGGLIGPGVKRIEGRLLEVEGEEYHLAVTSLSLLDGGYQVWSGEPVKLRKEYVTSAYERRFSLGRSIGLGVSVVGGFAAFLATRSLLGGGQGDNGDPGDTVATRVGRF